MIVKSWIYADKVGIIRIKAKRKPSYETLPKNSCTWVVNELINTEWVMPCFPEIGWNTLNKLKFLGCLKEEI